MNFSSKTFRLYAVAFILCCFACSKDKDTNLPETATTFEEVIKSGGPAIAPSVSSEVTTGNVETIVDGNTIWECTTETHSIEASAGGNEGFPLFSPNSNVIYPGNLLQGASLGQGTPDVIPVQRAGGSISTDVVDGNIQSSFEVESISKSEVTDAINNIILGSTGVVPANFSLKIENIQSKEQFALELGLDVNSTFVDVAAKLNYDTESEKNTFMVNLTQSFYTMSYDIPTSLEAIFHPSVTPADLQKYVGEGNPATYISDVTYGRVYYLLVESSSSTTEMAAKINASFNGVATQVEASIDASYLSQLEELKISLFAYGGEAGATLMTASTTEDLSKLVGLLAKSSNIQSGKPISYVVRSVYDNQIVSTQLASTYDITNCEEAGVANPLPQLAHWTGEVNKRLGPVTAAYIHKDDNLIILLNEKGQWMSSSINANGVGTLNGPHSWGSLPFDGVGAACIVLDLGHLEKLLVVNKAGTHFAYRITTSAGSSWTEVKPISELPTNPIIQTNPFAQTGIGALIRGKARSINVDPTRHGESFYMVNNPGDKFCRYFPSSPFVVPYDPVQNVSNWGAENSVTNKIDGIGAGIGMTTLFTQINILFDKSGTSYVIQGNVNGDNPNEVVGPFPL